MKRWVKEINTFGKSNTPIAFFVSFDGNKGEVIPLADLNSYNVHMNFPFYKEELTIGKQPNFVLKSNTIDFNQYSSAFDKVQYHLHRGDSYLTNLTFATPVQLNADLKQIYIATKAKYQILYKDKWVCFSPETFIQIKDNSIKTFPMKGTIDASIPNASNILSTDRKEVAEHHTVVDLLRNDLSHVARNVNVSRLMYLEEIQTQKGKILQMSSEIVGKLDNNWHSHLGDILNQLIPAGSISGAPKEKTVNIIKDVEIHDRGFYTGIAGIYDGQSVDSCVLIRFIEKSEEGFVYKSGGGITALSSLEEEYKELNQKIYVPIY